MLTTFIFREKEMSTRIKSLGLKRQLVLIQYLTPVVFLRQQMFSVQNCCSSILLLIRRRVRSSFSTDVLPAVQPENCHQPHGD